MRILVTGGTGTVGSEVVERLQGSDGVEPVVLTRSPEKAKETPAGVAAAVGDLLAPDSLSDAFEGVDRVFLLTPLHPREAEMGRNAIAAAKDAGAHRIVFMSVHRAEEASLIPHFRTKVEIAEALAESEVNHTVLYPNNFYQNDAWVVDTIREQGVYPHPIGNVGLSRVDARDIADAAARLLTDDGHDPEPVPLVGPEALTGEECAAIWGRVLGREVSYIGDRLDVWERSVRGTMPPELIHDLQVMYDFFIQEGLVATDEELAREREVLGRDPRPYADFVKQVAAGANG